jgi:hypothetical protein
MKFLPLENIVEARQLLGGARGSHRGGNAAAALNYGVGAHLASTFNLLLLSYGKLYSAALGRLWALVTFSHRIRKAKSTLRLAAFGYAAIWPSAEPTKKPW